MGSWEDELDLDLSDIWAAGSKPVQEGTQAQAEDDGDDDLEFPTQAPLPRVSQLAHQGQPETRVTGLQSENGVARLLSENGVTPLRNVDVSDAPTQLACLTAEPYISRGGSTVPSPTQNLASRGNNLKQRLPPLPSFQPIIPRDNSPAPIATQNLASRESDPKQRSRDPISKERVPQPPADIRKYFTHRGSPSGVSEDEGAPRKKPRIPGPVGDLFQKDQRGDGDALNGDGNGDGFREDDFNDRIFRRGAWVSALQSLNIEEFDPARYAILKVTASTIGSSRSQQHVPHFVAVIKELTPNVFGDAAVILKDPTGTVAGMMNNKVFSNTDYARAISPGAAIVLKQVAIFSPSAHYLNITINNVVQVFAANTDFPREYKAAKQQHEPLPQKEQLLQPRSQLQPSPPQQEKPPSQQELQAPERRPSPSPSPRTQEPKVPDGIAAAAGMANWDLMSPSPSPPPSPPQDPKGPDGITEAAKMAGWDLIDDMEALLNEDVDDFYA